MGSLLWLQMARLSVRFIYEGYILPLDRFRALALYASGRRRMRPAGILIVLVTLTALGLPDAFGADIDGVPRVRSKQFDVTYSINESAAPLERVDLWHRVPGSDGWARFGRDADLVSPIRYSAEQEGLHELFFVLTNAAGSSGPLPEPNTIPHLSVFVDYTPPLVQLQRVHVYTNANEQLIVRFEWSAMDAHLSARPIRIAYRRQDESDWKSVKTRLPNTGLYEWQVPDNVTGSIRFHLSVTDQGGNISYANSKDQQITRTPVPNGQANPPIDGMNKTSVERLQVPGTHLSASEQHRLNQLLKRGIALQDSLHDSDALQQFRSALSIDPRHTGALVNLGESLYALGRYQEATTAYQTVLAQSPKQPAALLGLAETLIEKKQFEAAESKLLDLVASGRHDAAAWLRLGDIAAYKGQEFAAHDYYVKAASTRSTRPNVTELAKTRLSEMSANRKKRPGKEHREAKRN